MPKFSGGQFLQAVKDIDGNALKELEQDISGNIKEKGNLSLRQAIRLALNHCPDKSDDDKKLDYFGVVRKLYPLDAGTEVELTNEEIVLIKAKCKQRWSPEALGFIVAVLEEKNNDFRIVSRETTPTTA